MKLKPNDIIEVHGFVMLKGLNEGKYKVKRIGNYHGFPTYILARPKGKKPILHFFADQIDTWIRPKENEDLNKIVIQEN